MTLANPRHQQAVRRQRLRRRRRQLEGQPRGNDSRRCRTTARTTCYCKARAQGGSLLSWASSCRLQRTTLSLLERQQQQQPRRQDSPCTCTAPTRCLTCSHASRPSVSRHSHPTSQQRSRRRAAHVEDGSTLAAASDSLALSVTARLSLHHLPQARQAAGHLKSARGLPTSTQRCCETSMRSVARGGRALAQRRSTASSRLEGH